MIVIGVDFSDGSGAALRHGVRAAAALGTTARAVHVIPATSDLVERTPRVAERRADEQARLTKFVDGLGPHPVHVDVVVPGGEPAKVLLDEAAGADLLVVGRRGMGAVAATMLGSVSHAVARHARGPVMVVPPDAPADRPLRRVFAGADGSETSVAAVAWAAAAARRYGVPLVVVHSVLAATAYAAAAGLGPATTEPVDPEAGSAYAESLVERLRRDDPDLDVTAHVSTRGPADALLEPTGPDDLIVVGTHGRGAALRLLLGSTSASCIERAACPVVVVPAVTAP